MTQFKEEKKQIDFLLKDLYFARTTGTYPYNCAIVEFSSKTKVYNVLTNETYMPIKKASANILEKSGDKFAYDIVPLAQALISAKITKADALLTKQDVEFLRSELVKKAVSALTDPEINR